MASIFQKMMNGIDEATTPPQQAVRDQLLSYKTKFVENFARYGNSAVEQAKNYLLDKDNPNSWNTIMGQPGPVAESKMWGNTVYVIRARQVGSDPNQIEMGSFLEHRAIGDRVTAIQTNSPTLDEQPTATLTLNLGSDLAAAQAKLPAAPTKLPKP